MDISNWGIGRIMELPDHLFGARFLINFGGDLANGVTGYYISELALPEKCVIWSLFINESAFGGMAVVPQDLQFTYKLGDQLPTAANLAAMEPLFKGVDYAIGGEKIILPFSGVLGLRKGVESSGRRVCLRVGNFTTDAAAFSTGIVVSSVPKEIPDWMISAKA